VSYHMILQSPVSLLPPLLSPIKPQGQCAAHAYGLRVMSTGFGVTASRMLPQTRESERLTA
jgi:hypothetical protein